MVRRILSTLVVVVATALVSGSLMTLVYARGLGVTLGPWGALAHIPAIAVFVGLLWVALVLVRRVDRSRAGLVWTREESLHALLAFVAVTVSLTVMVAVAGALVRAPLTRSGAPVSLGALWWAALSFAGSSAVQQLSTQSIVVATSPDEGPSRRGLLLAVAIFTLAHAGVSSSWMYLPNVALFGLATSLIFVSGPRPRFGLSIGMHAGWNFTQIALLGAPFGASYSETAVFRWPAGPSSLFGQSSGLDEGALFTVAVVPWVLFALWRRRRTNVALAGSTASS
jgi:hypothetical protein